MDEEQIVNTLPDKSKSLRKTSVKKRLQTEIKKANPKLKQKICKKPKLSKYQRKVANAKERERMKKMNEVFETLRNVVPADKLADTGDDKDTKVTTLRSAIAYINSLKKLIEDCDAGLVDRDMFSFKEKSLNEMNVNT